MTEQSLHQPKEKSSKRMSKEDRRIHLLQTALEVIREEGIEALTLIRLAERAGVTKPITYEHFGTRAGLLSALFLDYDNKATEALRSALNTGIKTLEEVAAILSSSYIDTCLEMGPEIRAVYNSLSTTPETEAFRQSWREFIVDEFHKAFSPFVKLTKKHRPLLMGFLGAAEILAEAAVAERVSRREAVAALTHLLVSALK